MINSLPAVLVGGPPHAGKTVLLHSLSRALYARGISHYIIRASPDGEGSWSQESHTATASLIRRNHKGKWPEHFITRVGQNLSRRWLPLLVDMGGKPSAAEQSLFRQCTHAILLLRADNPTATQDWHRIVEDNNLLLLAKLCSQQHGTSELITQEAIIEGTICNLERGQKVHNDVLDALVERIASLFGSFDLKEREQIAFEQAPFEVFNLYNIVPLSERWYPNMLPLLLTELLAQSSYSIYGRAPNWVCAAIAGHLEKPFYQFDPRLCWIEPLPLYFSTTQHPEVHARQKTSEDATLLEVDIPSKQLEYFQPEPIPFPSVSAEKGVVISGVVPQWLITALVQLYKGAHIPWIAAYDPRFEKAVVVYSRVDSYHPGDLVPVPAA